MEYKNLLMNYFGSKQCRKISNWITEDNSGESGERQPKVGVSADEVGTFKADYKLSSSVFERQKEVRNGHFRFAF